MPEILSDLVPGMDERRKIGFTTATALVLANMVGTGVFTSLGFQAAVISSHFALIMLWFIGGITALCGALTYGELASAMPRSGGEYIYLSRIYHPLLGFLSGWVSLTVGFAAPTALAAMALGTYAADVFPQLQPEYIALAVVAGVTAVHTVNLEVGSYFQVIFTSLKVILILLFIMSALFLGQPVHFSLSPGATGWPSVLSPAFAVSLVFVSYAYSGWNAAVYIAGEIRNPRRNLPKALFAGTLLVMVLYLLLNFVFLYTLPLNELTYLGPDKLRHGHVDVAFHSAVKIFGPAGGRIMAGTIALLLISSVSAMIFAGPRVAMSIGEDLPAFAALGRKNKKGLPVNAILFQAALTFVLIITASFEDVITYAGFTLALLTVLTVSGMFVLRFRFGKPAGYRTPLYPLPPLIFLAVSIWTLVFLMRDKPLQSGYGLLTMVIGIPVWYFTRKKTMAR